MALGVGASPSTSRPSRSDDGASTATPGGAGGFLFGASREQFANLCVAAGHTFDAPGVTSGTCTGTAGRLDHEARAHAEFCDDKLCILQLTIQIASPTDPLAVLKELRESLVSRYGDPTTKSSQIPSECADALAKCLADGDASIHYTWSWSSGFLLKLKPAAIDGSLVIAITYLTSSGVERIRAQGL